MKRLLSLLFVALFIMSILKTCMKNTDAIISDTDFGSLEHQTVDIMGVTYDLFDSGYATIVSLLHKNGEISETVSYEGKEYEVIAIGYSWDTYNKEWRQESIFKKNQYLPDNSPEILMIPQSIKHIGARAFVWSTAKQIKIPSHITLLHGSAFSECINLENIEFPESLITLNLGGAFINCKTLKQVVLPEGCEYNEINTLINWFLDCDSLESVTIPGEVSILENTFANCPKLSEVILNEGLKTIGVHTFYSCPNLSTLVFPESVSMIHGQTIVDCPNLTDITLPDGLNDIPADMFLDQYHLPADVSNLTIRVEQSMVSYVQSIYPTANVVPK